MGRQGDVAVSLAPASGRFDETSDTWLEQVAALRGELRAAVGVGAVAPLAVEPTPAVTGRAWQSIGVSITTAAALSALLAVVEAWLERDRSRSLTFTWTAHDGRGDSIELSGHDVAAARFEALQEAVTQRLTDG
jgi:hypothetical protein